MCESNKLFDCVFQAQCWHFLLALDSPNNSYFDSPTMLGYIDSHFSILNCSMA